jgi:hypothetical protein
MIDCANWYDRPLDSSQAGQPQGSNEVIIIIRDGKVVTFIQNRNRLLEGLYGDGI